jgi:hypothetical protein
VVASIALFVALGGGAYAVTKPPRNSVGPKQIKRNAVTGKKVKDQSLTGLDINLSKLGKVPNAALSDHATSADSATAAGTAETAANIAPPEAWHEVGTPGEPPFETGAGNELPFMGPNKFESVGFYKDREGVVHLKGLTHGTPDGVFRLPPGYRPAELTGKFFAVHCRDCASPIETLAIQGSGYSTARDGMVSAASTHIVSLDGVTFRAAG